MTSKNSFLTNMRQNLKRRNWVCAVFILYFLSYPVISLLTLMYKDVTSARLFFASISGVNQAGAVFFPLLAFLCAAQGFSYLQNREKVDMYHALPISKKKRFAVIYTNGVLLFAIPYLISILLCALVYLISRGTLPSVTLISLLTAFLQNLLYYLCIYNAAILATVLTGNIAMTFFATVFLLFYQNIVKILSFTLSTTFFDTFSGSSQAFDASVYGLFEPFTVFCASFYDSKFLLGAKGALCLLFYMAVMGILGYIAYQKRQDDAIGKAISFPKLQPIISLLIAVPFSLLMSILFYVSTNNTVLTVLGLFLGLLLAHGMLETVFAADLRSSFSHLRRLFANGVCAALILVFFAFDISGYDNYLPKEKDLSGISLSFWDFSRNDWQSFPVSDTEVAFSLAENALHTSTADANFSIDVVYHLTNQKEVSRRLYLNLEGNEALLNQLFADSGYKCSTTAFYEDTAASPHTRVEIAYRSRQYHYPLADVSAFREAYLKDWNAVTFSALYADALLGDFSVAFFSDDDSVSPQFESLPLMSSFTNTLTYLENVGATVADVPTVENVDSIAIFSPQGKQTQLFEQPAQIQALLDSVYMDSAAFSLRGGSKAYYSGSIRLNFKNGSNSTYDLTFKNADSIPDFLDLTAVTLQ